MVGKGHQDYQLKTIPLGKDEIIKMLIIEYRDFLLFSLKKLFNCHTALSCSQQLALNSEQYYLAQN